MQAMNELHKIGAISEEHMVDLRKAMREDNSLEGFKKHLDSISSNNLSSLTKNQRKRKRKQQKKSRGMSCV